MIYVPILFHFLLNALFKFYCSMGGHNMYNNSFDRELIRPFVDPNDRNCVIKYMCQGHHAPSSRNQPLGISVVSFSHLPLASTQYTDRLLFLLSL